MKSNLKFSKLGEVSEIFAGGDKPNNFSLLKDREHQVPVFANGETNSGLQGFTDKAKVKQPAVTVSARGTIGYAVLREEPFVPIVRLLTLIPDEKKLDVNYLYYYLTLYRQAGLGSSQPQLTVPDIANRKISMQSLSAQQAIGKTLSFFDKKIELNNKINAELEQMAKTLYDYWFVQFDFPDANGNPYKSSGGAMLYNEELKREIPKDWRVDDIRSFSNIFDSKRVPLSSKQRENRKGIFPYHGATEIMDYIDDYIFDGEYILLAEDGSVMNAEGFPNLQFVKGQFWANNHAHVLQAKELIHNEFLYRTLQYVPVVRMMTGSVQMKINQENLMSTKILIPSQQILETFSKFASPAREKIFEAADENQKLAELRDWLLPMLMNGQVTVK
tara:strand:+ start:984 stop:2147 length:1164 start_codon:yes stop_codon:yes gene_type:complete